MPVQSFAQARRAGGVVHAAGQGVLLEGEVADAVLVGAEEVAVTLQAASGDGEHLVYLHLPHYKGAPPDTSGFLTDPALSPSARSMIHVVADLTG